MWPHDLPLPAQGSIDRPNQAWAADICYLPMAKGFLYLVAIIDWYSRKVLAWRLSNTLDSHFCVEAKALVRLSGDATGVRC